MHFPVAVDVTYAVGKFTFTSGGKPVYNYYLYETGKTYEVDGTTVTATLAMRKPDDMVQFHIPDIGGSVANYTLGCSKIQPVACASVGTDGTITENVLQASARLSGTADSDGAIFAGRLASSGTKAIATPNYTFTLASEDKIYSYDVYDKTLEAGKMYTFPGLGKWVEQDVSNLYVDLGLSVKWATCNVGAATETGYGDYFAWGETTAKEVYGWDTYQWMQEGRSDWQHINKYTFADSQTEVIWYDGNTFVGDNKTCLQGYDNADDAAYAALGGKFRMPTDAEWKELIDHCTWTCETDYNSTGVNGMLVTSTVSGYKSNEFI